MIPNENREIVYEDKRKAVNSSNKLRIIAFNDVYNIDESKEEPVGGAARFYTAIEHFKSEQPCLVLFAGDALSPSTRNFLSQIKSIFFNELLILI